MQILEGVLSRGRMRPSGIFLLAVALLFMGGAFARAVGAQTSTGQISGTVTDSTGAVVVGAKVTLTYTLTNQQRDLVTGSSGDFFFTDLGSGIYTVSVTETGFQAFTQSNISLADGEKLSLHQLQLSVGSQTTEVTVTANEAHVETDTSEHANLVNSTQMSDVTVKGRNFMSYVALLPGVTTGGQSDAPGWGNNGDNEVINGGNNTVVVQLNGIANQDDGNNTLNAYLAPSADAIQEIRVQTNVMNAEYGSRNGGSVNVIFKGGAKAFHGSLFDYERNSMFNANTYFNKELPTTGPTAYNHFHPNHYTYTNPGGTIGGPVVIPGIRFNKNRDKLFIFFSADLLSRSVPCAGGQCSAPSTAPATLTMPTVAERAGNFSGIVNGDPAAGVNPLDGAAGHGKLNCPGNPTPLTAAQASNIVATCGGSSAAGIAFLNLLPLPNCNSPQDIANNMNPGLTLPACGNTGYNYTQMLAVSEPRSDYVMRGDYNISSTELWTVNLIKDYQCTCGSNFLGGSGWPSQLLTDYKIHSSGASSNLVSTIRPNLINEFLAGTNRALQTTTPATAATLAANQRNTASVNMGPAVLPVLFPDTHSPFAAGAQSKFANPNDLIPNASFGGGGLQNGPSFSVEGRWPFFGTDTHYNVTDNVSWVKGPHAFKFGFYFEKVSRNGPSGGTGGGAFNGTISFGQSGTNPLDAGFPYLNAYEGVFGSYQEQSDHPLGYDRWHSEEWFLQDTWKATRRLTLDYGIRFAHLIPTFENVPAADWRPDVYSPSSTVQPPLLYPCLVGGVRMAANQKPIANGTCPGATYTTTQSAVGLFVPQSVSSIAPFQGMVAYAPRQAVLNTPPLNYGPRFGFAYDLFGNGKTAIRGGFGMFYNVFGTVDTVGGLVLQPPPPTVPASQVAGESGPATSRQELTFAPSVLNSSFGTMLSSGTPQLFLGPQSVTALPRNFKSPASYSLNFGLQHDLGHGLLLDTQYVGELNRHNTGNYNLESFPYGVSLACVSGAYAGPNNQCATGDSLKWQDPTKSAGASNELSSVFFAPDPGYSGITYNLANLNSSYHSLQTQVTKRFGRALTMNLAWTYSRIMQWSEPNPIIAPQSVWRQVYYGDNGNHKHNVVVNWTYHVPNAPFNNAVLKGILNGWVSEGIFTYVSGAPGSVGVSAGGTYLINGGGGYGTRVNIVPGVSPYCKGCAPPSGGSGLREQYLNFAAFAPPTGGGGTCVGTAATCGFGNSGMFNYIGPAVNNWNTSLFKDFGWSKTNEARKLEIRWETYNSLNHTQFSGFASTNLSVSAPGAAQAGSNSTWGRFNSTQPARIMVLAARVLF